MTISPERALSGAVRAAALADASVRAILGDPARVYDEHPEDPVFPYATLGDVQSRPADSAGAPALEHGLTVHVWSRYGGRAEALDAAHALRAALHDQALTLTRRRLVFLFAGYTDVMRAGDGRTIHALLRLRALTEPN
jgi:hypothetical protein